MRLVTAGFLVAAWCLSSVIQAKAHSFNVALVIPLSGGSEIAGKQVIDGFMMATQERDNHPDNHADGHLGGLDVYVYPADNQEMGLASLRSILANQSIDIIVSIGSGKEIHDTIATIASADTIVLNPGRLPYPMSRPPGAAKQPQGLVDFKSAFQRKHGYEPTEMSAQGYNEARRIDAAIRPLDSVDDKTELRKRLEQTANEFSW